MAKLMARQIGEFGQIGRNFSAAGRFHRKAFIMIPRTLLCVAGTACVATLAFVSLQAADSPPAPPTGSTPAAQAKPQEGGHKHFFHRHPFDRGRWAGKDGRFQHRGPADGRCGWGFGHHADGMETLLVLNLTDEQKAKVKEVMEADKEKILAILKEQREKIAAVKAESEKAIRPILTDEQKAVFDDAKKLRESGEKLREDIRKLHADKAAKTDKEP
jgi:Spy/CpxP family protein refolding chaperone